jgi:hypothetical protein
MRFFILREKIPKVRVLNLFSKALSPLKTLSDMMDEKFSFIIFEVEEKEAKCFERNYIFYGCLWPA